jgi:hypothetical protein
MRRYAPILVYEDNGDIRADMVEVEPYNGLFVLADDAEKIKRALAAAVAFIESHAADPDITSGMLEKYKLYLEAMQALGSMET